MSEPVYVDTNVYISYFQEEHDGLRPISDFAFEFFKRTIQCTYTIIISSWVLRELEHKIPHKQLRELLGDLQQIGKLQRISTPPDLVAQAKKNDH